MKLFSRDALREVARVYHDIGESLPDSNVLSPTREQYLAAAENAGVPVAVLQTIWQIETLQVALLAGAPVIRIEGGHWKKFGGDPRDLPKPLNPGGGDAGARLKGQLQRLANLDALRRIDPIRAIAITSHGGPQIMGWNAEHCGCVDERDFESAMRMGSPMQLVLMTRFILNPANAAMRDAMQRKNAEAIAHHWNGPAFRKNDYHTKVAAGLRRFS